MLDLSLPSSICHGCIRIGGQITNVVLTTWFQRRRSICLLDYLPLSSRLVAFSHLEITLTDNNIKDVNPHVGYSLEPFEHDSQSKLASY